MLGRRWRADARPYPLHARSLSRTPDPPPSHLRAANGRAPVDGILAAIGDTPLVALHRYLLRPDVAAWAKLEAANPGGSAKDRPAARMLQDALDEGLVDLGTTVVESTSGTRGSDSPRPAATTGCA